MDLRNEIIEAQKVRSDLFKWKLVLVAAIGAAALGIGASSKDGQGVQGPDYLLCLVPLVCVYTDVLCAHLNLRVRVIGRFLTTLGNPPFAAERPADDTELNVRYEHFANKARNQAGAYVFEDWALHLSSEILSAFVIIWGLLVASGSGSFKPAFPGEPCLLWVAGILGIGASLVARLQYNRLLSAIERLE